MTSDQQPNPVCEKCSGEMLVQVIPLWSAPLQVIGTLLVVGGVIGLAASALIAVKAEDVFGWIAAAWLASVSLPSLVVGLFTSIDCRVWMCTSCGFYFKRG